MSATPALCARSLDVGYGGATVVAGIDVAVAPGDTLAVVGTNGSGKSTFLKTVVALEQPVGGTLEVLGGRPGAAPARVAYVAQHHRGSTILPIRARDVVAMGRFAGKGLLGRLGPEDRRLIDAALERMGITDLAGEALRDLSGGQRQRVHLAQALARQPDLLVVDEPTSGLDAVGRHLLEDALAAERARGCAVIVATHDMAEAMRADGCLLLAGRVVAAGPPREVVTPARLVETFGLVITDMGDGVLVMDREHQHDHED